MEGRKAGVAGTGRIGAGLATLLAGNGFSVAVVGRRESSVTRCLAMARENLDDLVRQGLLTSADRETIAGRITGGVDYGSFTGCEMVMEAVSEEIAVKRSVFQQIEAAVEEQTMLVSATSAIPAAVIAEHLRLPRRFAVAHPFQPSHLLPLIELVPGPQTDPAVLAQMKAWLEALGREVVVLQKDVPGFVVNRLAQALFREALYLVGQGVVTPADLDKAVKYAVGMRYANIGLLEYFDDVGFALEAEIAKSVYPSLCSSQEIAPIVRQGLRDGATGRSAGRGLYDWTEKDEQDYLKRKNAAFYGCFDWKPR